MKQWTGGYYIIMNSSPKYPGDRPLMDIGYKQNSRNFLGIIATDIYGITEAGDPYLSRLPNNYSNISVLPVVYPIFLDRHFNACNAIEHNNRTREPDLSPEKYCVTQSGYYILETTVQLDGLQPNTPPFSTRHLMIFRFSRFCGV